MCCINGGQQEADITSANKEVLLVNQGLVAGARGGASKCPIGQLG